MSTPAITTRAGPRASARIGRFVRRHHPGYLMLLPFLAVFVGFVVWPLGNSLYFAFTDFNGVTAPVYTGTDNFRRLWLEDERFRHALTNTLTYVGASVTITTVLALLLALAFRTTSWRDRIMRTLFFLPSVTSSIAVALIWRWIFSTENFGLANTFIGWFGFEAVQWLGTPSVTIPILVIMAVWGGCGYAMVIFVAGLNAIPDEYYESARLDGANVFQQFWYITVPQLRPVTTYVLITGLITAFQVFEAVYVVFRGGSNNIGAVLDSGLMIVPYLYDMGFTKFRLGYASAVAWTLFLIILIISLVQLRISRTTKDM